MYLAARHLIYRAKVEVERKFTPHCTTSIWHANNQTHQEPVPTPLESPQARPLLLRYWMEVRHLRGHAVKKGPRCYFKTVKLFGTQIIVDAYFDKANLLADKGIWVRRRACFLAEKLSESQERCQWEAKVRIGGNFIDSKFEEVAGQAEVSRLVAEHLQGTTTDEQRPFWRHANIMAELHTTRYGWQIDDAFNVAIDCVPAEKHNFRHWVGEVERAKTVESSSEEGLLEAKRMAAARMDEEIREFMERYRWAFSADKPIGKLSAFFALKRLRAA